MTAVEDVLEVIIHAVSDEELIHISPWIKFIFIALLAGGLVVVVYVEHFVFTTLAVALYESNN